MSEKNRKCLPASYTVEAAGVLATVFLTTVILLTTVFHVHAEVKGMMQMHRLVEQKRHAVEYAGEQKIREQAAGRRWSLDIQAPVFRPEDSLRRWSLVEEWK